MLYVDVDGVLASEPFALLHHDSSTLTMLPLTDGLPMVLRPLASSREPTEKLVFRAGRGGRLPAADAADRCREEGDRERGSERAARSEDADPVYGHLLWQLWRNIRLVDKDLLFMICPVFELHP